LQYNVDVSYQHVGRAAAGGEQNKNNHQQNDQQQQQQQEQRKSNNRRTDWLLQYEGKNWLPEGQLGRNFPPIVCESCDKTGAFFLAKAAEFPPRVLAAPSPGRSFAPAAQGLPLGAFGGGATGDEESRHQLTWTTKGQLLQPLRPRPTVHARWSTGGHTATRARAHLERRFRELL